MGGVASAVLAFGWGPVPAAVCGLLMVGPALIVSSFCKARRGNICWFICAMSGCGVTVGTAVCVATVYVGLSKYQPQLAGLLLSVLIPAVECFVAVLPITAGYEKYVYRKRRTTVSTVGDPWISGDQKWGLSLCTSAVLCIVQPLNLAALLAGAIRDPRSISWVWALILQLLSNVPSRLLIYLWRVAKATDGSENKLVNMIHQLHLPTSVTLLYKDLKFTLGYPRFGVIFVILAQRGFEQGFIGIASEEGTRAALQVGFFAFLEEFLEDLLVIAALRCNRRCSKWELVPDWASREYYENLELEHPYQVVNNPSLRYHPMPSLMSLFLVLSAMTASYGFLVMLLGQKWVLGETFCLEDEDITAFIWPLVCVDYKLSC